MDTKISVIIPTYNRAQLIVRSLESVLKQTLLPSEIIVVDDGSTDNTTQVITDYISSLLSDFIPEINPLLSNSELGKLIRYIKKENGGASSARNVGVQNAKYPIIAFNDSDDVWHSDKLEIQMNYWALHPEFSMIYSAYLKHCIDNSEYLIPQSPFNLFEGDMYLPLLVSNTVGPPTMLVYKDAILDCGGFDESLASLEDWDFAIRFAQKYLLGFINDSLVDVYQTEGSVSYNTPEHYNVRCQMIAKHRKALVENNLFDLVVSDMFTKAQRLGCLESVKKMLMLYLQ